MHFLSTRMRPMVICTILFATFLTRLTAASAFVPVDRFGISCSFANCKAPLFATPPRQPRRMLKKKRRRREGESFSNKDAFPWDTAESRPLVPSVSKETGEDYWMDEEDMEREKRRVEAIANRVVMEGETPKEKLWMEVKAPYKQNWIGIFTMMILILSVIVVKFPESLEYPVIPIPDL